VPFRVSAVLPQYRPTQPLVDDFVGALQTQAALLARRLDEALTF
jgi:hypothetical protein